jgi:outer membrane lipoprotein carrier protein
MIARYERAARLVLPALLAGALAAGCGGDGERPAGDEARDGAPSSGVVAETPPAGLEGPGVGAPPVTGDPDGVAGADGRGATVPGASPGAAGSTEGAGSPGAATPSPGTGQAASTEAILRATSRAYAEVRSLRAGFQQQIRNPLLGRTTRSSGTLYQRQPDRFLMEFSDPDGDVIVSDGQYFWIYYPSVNPQQVIRTPRGAQGLDLHSQFIGDPVTRFEATSHGTESVAGRAAHVLTLVPRQAAGYRSLKVWIDANDHLVRRFELTEDNGSVRRVELSDLAINPSLPDHLFQFTPPPGAQVIQR